LSRKNEVVEQGNKFPTLPPTPTSKPEVFYIQYRTGKTYKESPEATSRLPMETTTEYRSSQNEEDKTQFYEEVDTETETPSKDTE
jgi:hypothetical protein